MEELDTGATHWAVRYERDGRIELDLGAGPPTRSAYYVSEVGPARASWLNEQGLSVPEAMAAKASGLLRVWLQMYVDNARGEPLVAHLVITGPPRPDTAEVTALRVLQDVPLPDLTRLAHHGLCLAAEAGARQITSSIHHLALTEASMHSHHGRLTFDALAPWPVPATLRQT